MSDHAVLISTSVGPTAGIVSEPEGPPRAALVLLQGDGGPARAGVNAFWTRMARGLAEMGIVVLRVDYASHGDGSMIQRDHAPQPGDKEDVDATLLGEATAWFSERVGDVDLFVAGDCRGGRLAIELTPFDLDIAGLLLIVPYVRNQFVAVEKREERTGRLDDVDILHRALLDGLRDTLRRGFVWVLMGAKDGDDALRLRHALGPAGEALELEVVDGVNVHPATQPEIQRLVAERLTMRVLRALEARETAGGDRRAPSSSQPRAVAGRVSSSSRSA